MIETLNTRFQNLSQLYEKIQISKRTIEELSSKFATIKMLTDENIDLKMRLTRMTEEKTKIILERPILRREELSMLENDVFNLRQQNESLKRDLASEKERNLALIQENSNLTKDRRDLIDKLQLIDEERKVQYSDYRNLANQKADLERRLNMKTGELESLKHNTNPSGIVNNVSNVAQDNQALKKLMEQNEKLIHEINVLKTGKTKPIDIDKLQNPDAKQLYEAHQKAYELEKKNLDLQSKLNSLQEQVEMQKTLNSELILKQNTIEYKYQQLQLEHNSLKNPQSTNRDASPFSTPRRIFEKDQFNESPRPNNQSYSPNPRTTIGDMTRNYDKTTPISNSDKGSTDQGTSATKPRTKIF